MNSKPNKTNQSYHVKFNNKTGGAYVEINAVIESERQSWEKAAITKPNHNYNLKPSRKK